MKMAMNRFGIYIETEDGTQHGPFRVTYRHRTQAEKTCKARGIDGNSNEAELWLAWLVARDQDGTPFAGLDREAFTEAIFDYTVQRLEPDTADELDPTPPAL